MNTTETSGFDTEPGVIIKISGTVIALVVLAYAAVKLLSLDIDVTEASSNAAVSGMIMMSLSLVSSAVALAFSRGSRARKGISRGSDLVQQLGLLALVVAAVTA